MPAVVSATDDLAALERQIERGMQSFVEVGLALAAIRDRQLYRATHGTFEDYLNTRWGFGRAHGYRLINAAAVAQIVSPQGDIPQPLFEKQMRPLVGVSTRTAQEVWREATAGGQQPTAHEVEQLTARALAGLTAEQQRQVIEEAERDEIERAVQRDGLPDDARLKRLRRADRHLEQALKLVGREGDRAERVRGHILAAIAATQALWVGA